MSVSSPSDKQTSFNSTAHQSPAFQQSPGRWSPVHEASPTPASDPQPAQDRPKGRWIFGLLLVGGLAFAGYECWNQLFRYSAYGVVRGKVVTVAAPCAGAVRSVHVHSGEQVAQGQPLVRIYDADREQKLHRIADKLRVAVAEMHAQSARLRWQARTTAREDSKATAEFFEALGRFRRIQSEQKLSFNRRERAQKLRQSNERTQAALTQDQFDRIFFEARGKQRKLKALEKAVDQWNRRAQLAEACPGEMYDQLAPALARIEMLSAELRRARDSVNRGRVRAPTNGQVLEWHARAGEWTEIGDPVLSILEEGSSYVELLLPQERTRELAVGTIVDIEFASDQGRRPCKVVRVGERMDAPPKQLQRYYSPDEKLLPVILEPVGAPLQQSRIRPGTVTRLPTRLPWQQRWGGK